MTQESKYFEVVEGPDAVELRLGTSDFVSRPIITLALDDLIEYIDTNKPKRVVLNLKNVHHVSSEFITAMIRLHDHVGGHDGIMKFSHMSDQVLLPFKLTNLAGNVFKIYDTTPQAIDAF